MNGSERRAEYLIVGGGIIGLALACELLRRKRSTRLLEWKRPGGGATAAAAGMLAPVSEAPLEAPELLSLGRDSLARFPDFVTQLERLSGLSCPYGAEGTLWVALHRDHRAELDHLAETLERKGLAAQVLGADEVRGLEPHLSGRVVGGLRVAGDHQVDPRALTRCLERAVLALGGTIDSGMRVERIERSPGGLWVRGSGAGGAAFAIQAPCVIVAAGAWSTSEIRLPIGDLGLRPVKGQLVRLRGPRLLRQVVRTPDVYLVPRADGELLVGGTIEEMGCDVAPTGGAVMDLMRRGWEALPGIYELELVEVSVGLRSAVDDHLPVIGPSGTEGLFLAFGHYRNGVLLAPSTAHHLAEWLVSGTPPAELRPFSPERLLPAKLSRSRG